MGEPSEASRRKTDGEIEETGRRGDRADDVAAFAPSPGLPFRLLYRVARERVGEDDDAGEHVGHLDLVRACEYVSGLEAVECFVEVVVGVDDSAFEFETGEESLAARVGEYAGVEREVRRGAGRASD